MSKYIDKINWRLWAYVLLVVAVIFAIAQDARHFDIEHQRLKAATQSALIADCQNGNRLRASLSDIFSGYALQIRELENKHLISASLGLQLIKELDNNTTQLAAIPCSQVNNISKHS